MTYRTSILIATLAIAVAGMFWGGYVSAVLWAWFAVPLGAPEITFLHAAGLSLLLSSFLGARGMVGDIQSIDRLDRWEKLGNAIAFAIILPTLALATGFVIRALM